MDRLNQYAAKDIENDHVEGLRENELRDRLRSEERITGWLLSGMMFVCLLGIAGMSGLQWEQRGLIRQRDDWQRRAQSASDAWSAAVTVAEQLKAERDDARAALAPACKTGMTVRIMKGARIVSEWGCEFFMSTFEVTP